MKRKQLWHVAAGLVLLVAALPSLARAEVPGVMRQSTRAMWAAFELGGTVSASKHVSQFKIAPVFAYRFNPGGEGFAVGGSAQISLGDGVLGLQIGPRVWYDYQPFKDLALFIAPTAQAGWGFVSGDGDRAFSAFNIQIGCEPRLVLGDRGLIYVRVVPLDLWIGESFSARLDFMLGGGVTF